MQENEEPASLQVVQTFEDFNSIEKSCRLPDETTTEGMESGMEPLANMGDAFTISMERMEDEQAPTEIQAEIEGITMTAGYTVITADLSDSGTIRAFLETLPRTFTMNRYGDREYFGRMETIAEDGDSIADFDNGDVTDYPAGPSFAVFFDNADTLSQSGLIGHSAPL